MFIQQGVNMTEMQEKATKFIENRYNTPIKDSEHYEVKCSNPAEAEELAYQISDGMGPMVEAETENDMLYFRNDIVAGCLDGSNTDFAEVVAGWPIIKEKGVEFVAGSLTK
jgi:hypothetical protein